MERDENDDDIGGMWQDFNSHAHVERDRQPCGTCENIFNFNSHAHVERDMCGTNFGNGAKISTHTLTWSVTVAGKEVEYLVGNFNSHAHVERDRSADVIYRNAGHFNSHAHVERDKFITCSSMVSGISTHTLTWSVTYKL